MAGEREKRIPRYREVMDALIGRMQAGAFSFDEPLCTEAALMAEFEVSRITARRALDELEERGLITRKRGIGCFVSRAAYEHLNKTAQGPQVCAEPQAELFALIFPDTLSRESMRTAFEAAGEALSAQGFFAAAYLSSAGPEDKPGALLTRLASMDIAGAALMTDAPAAVQAEISRLLLQKKAVVLLDCASPYPHVSAAAFDELSGAALLVSHLCGLGHKRIAYFSEPAGDALGAPSRRMAGVLLALSEHGLPINPELLCSSGDPQALRRCLSAGATAIIADNAAIAQRLAHDCTAMGVRIPASMSLCCLGSCAPIPALRRGAKPIAVTCTGQDMAALGREAAQLLLQCAAEPLQPAHSLLLPVALCPGASTAAPREEK